LKLLERSGTYLPRYNERMTKNPKRPRDPLQLAKLIGDIATKQAQDQKPVDDGKDPAAVSLGRKGGLKGGFARAEKLTAAKRSEIAKKAAKARWKSTEQREAVASPKKTAKRKVLSVDQD
jgi:hypothetical protein